LPHFDRDGLPQFVTYRLYDSMPQDLLKKWKVELKNEKAEYMGVAFRKRVETYLDQSYGSCFLRDERVAQIVQDAMLFFDNERYRLYSWVVMPNHVHILFTPINDFMLEDIMHSWKSFTAKEANKTLKREGHFWFREYFDRFIRNEEHFNTVVAYIENNPVKAKLCKTSAEWKFSSAWFKALK